MKKALDSTGSVYFEFRKQRNPKANSNVNRLKALSSGESCVISYAGRTRFAVWIAIQRKRLGKPFTWRKLPGGQYNVTFIDEDARHDSPVLVQGRCPDALKNINWSKGELTERERKAVVSALNAFSYSPRGGKDGGLMQKTAVKLKMTRQQVSRHINHMMASSALVPRSSSDELWPVVREFTKQIASSRIIWLHEEIDAHLKKGVPVDYVCTAKQLQTFVRCINRRGYEVETAPSPRIARAYTIRLID
jgi:hypothetical protein